eukprot:792915-Alexandrium_andersonii.AAC.1
MRKVRPKRQSQPPDAARHSRLLLGSSGEHEAGVGARQNDTSTCGAPGSIPVAREVGISKGGDA